MLSRRGQSLFRAAKLSFAGTGLLERMRSTTFALLGITAAMGLGLVAVAFQQDWPLLPAAPIPGLPGNDRPDDAMGVAKPHSAPATQRPVGARVGSPNPSRSAPAHERETSQVSGSHQLATAPSPPAPNSAADTPSVPSAPVASEPSEPSSDGSLGSSPATGSEPARAPATPTSTSPSQSVAVSTSSDQDRSRGKGKSKPAGWQGGKSDESDSPAATPAPVVEKDESSDEADAEVEPSKDDSDAYRGKGHGHAYGHYGK